MSQETGSERQIVEQYLKLYALEEYLDEAINDVVEKRPKNPYMSIARSMEAKTLPEILSIDLSPIIIGQGVCGVEAVVLTNITSFSGKAAYSSEIPTGTDILRDFTVIREKVREAFVNIDPRDVSGIDKVLAAVPGMDTPISLAISIACCRAGARHRGMPLFKFLAESCGNADKMKMPLPVVSVLSRGLSEHLSQVITLTPTTTTSFDGSMEAALKGAFSVCKKINDMKPSMMTSVSGCPRSIFPSIGEAVQFVTSALVADTVEGGLKPGVHVLGSALSHCDEASDLYTYQMDGLTGPSKSANDQVDLIMGLWKDNELVAIEDPFHFGDLDSLRGLKSKITQAINEVKKDPSSTQLQYCKNGIGGDDGCALQVVADGGCTDASFVVNYESEMVFNTVKISLQKIGTISQAISLCDAARNANLSIVISCDSGSTPETDDSFLADFAVAMGAAQFMAGGVLAGEHMCKYNRLMEIGRENESILFSFLGRRFRK